MMRNPWRNAAIVIALLAGGVVGCVTPGTGASSVPPPAGGGLVGVNVDVPSQPGARNTVVSYGPFTVPAARGTAHGQEGMIKNAFRFGVQKPCTNCYITGMRADLKYPDGRTANIDTGLWLHHMVLFQSGKTDASCPATGVGLLGQRFFASGNERTRVRSQAGYGYQVGGAANTWILIYDLMNSNPQTATVKIDMSFDWVPQTTAGMKPVTPVWLDVNQCLTSEVPAQTGSYSYRYTWPASFAGKLLGVGGHVHDGGTHLTVTNAGPATSPRNDLMCNSVANYGGPGYDEPMDHGGDDHDDTMAGMQHISSMTQCVAPDGNQPVGTVSPGDRVQIAAYYNTGLHPQHGSHPVMGIAVAYFATS
jgi:hypothetical protein